MSEMLEATDLIKKGWMKDSNLKENVKSKPYVNISQ